MEKTDTNYTFHDTLRGSGIYCDHAELSKAQSVRNKLKI